MKKRFKEYRMFLFCLVLLILFSALAIFCLLQKETLKAIALLVMSLVTLFLLTSRFKMILFDDMMIIYEWKFVALMPSAISYEDILSVEKKSKHHLIIHHTKDSHIYVFNSDLFIDTYHAMKEKH